MRCSLLTLVCLGLLSGNAHAQPPAETPSEEGDQVAEQQVAEVDPDDPHGVAAMRREELSDEAAMSLFNAASSLYEAGRFLDAAEQFEAAYELSPRPSLLFNAYLAYRDAGRNQSAVRALAAYLEGAPDAPDAERLTARLAAMRDSANQDAEAEAEAAAERERLAAAAAAAEQRAEEERQRAEEAEERRPSTLGIVIAATGGAALVAGAATALVANGRFTTLQEDCPTEFCSTRAELEENAPGIRRIQRATDVLLFGGAAVAITGLVLTFALRSSSAPAAQPTASCDFDSCELGVRGSF